MPARRKIPKAYEKRKVGKSSKLIREEKALDRVALTPEDFRRVAILKDVHPQVMPQDRSSPWAYFHKSDLALINGDTFSWFIRHKQSWENKYKKAVNRGETFSAPQPKPPYAELIRSRYPTVADAIRDLDDGLTTVALVSQLASVPHIDAARIRRASELIAEFHFYVAKAQLLKKGFISVKGYYFEASIEMMPVIWRIPHRFPLQVEEGVDYKVIADFLELYENLLSFINAHLYRSIEMKYPPSIDQEKWAKRLYIDSIMDQEEAPKYVEAEENENSKSLEEEIKKASEAVPDADEEELVIEKTGIFAGLRFVIDSKVPADPFIFVIRSLGGEIEYFDPQSLQVNYEITDRKELDGAVIGRSYVQPQWVFDCLNEKRILPVDDYIPGAILPVHRSPFEGIEEIPDSIDAELENQGSDDEIDEEIQRIALESEFSAGVADKEGEEIDLKKLREEKKLQKKQEMEELLSHTLTNKKSRLYKKLKGKTGESGQPEPVPSVEDDDAGEEDDPDEEEEAEE